MVVYGGHDTIGGSSLGSIEAEILCGCGSRN